MSKTQPSLPSVWQTLAEINLADHPGVDQLASDQTVTVVRSLNLSPVDLDRLQMAVAEAVLKAIEPNNHYPSDFPASIRLRVFYRTLAGPITKPEPTLSLTTNERNRESSRGWGFFLTERIVDDTQTAGEMRFYSIELFLYRE